MNKFLSQYKNSYFVGFNSINFDEEFFRQILWEHFMFPYLTNTNGNSRLDIYNFVTMVHAFRSEMVNVQKNENGKINFKLENLAKANNFNSDNAHDAIADVEVTMDLMKMLVEKNADMYRYFLNNSIPNSVLKRIIEEKVFTLHSYLFNSHRIYMVKYLLKHPVYKSQVLAFDLKYDPSELINFNYEELYDTYKNKSYFRKIKINKQPTILDYKFSKKHNPYSDFSDEEIELKCRQLDNEEFLGNINRILEREAEEYNENKSQVQPYEEETIYIPPPLKNVPES